MSRSSNGARRGAKGFLATLLSGLLVVTIAPTAMVATAPAAMAEVPAPTDATEPSLADGAGGVATKETKLIDKTEGPKTKKSTGGGGCKENCTPGTTEVGDPTEVGRRNGGSFEAWFYEADKGAYITMPYGVGPYVNFDSVAIQCGGTPADRSFPYDGNGIPLPGPGQAGERRLVWDAWTTTLIDHAQGERVMGREYDPLTGTFKDVVIEEFEYTWTDYEYVIDCLFQTAPRWEPYDCAVQGEFETYGPYDQQWAVMRSPDEGGDNTRVNPVTGNVDGKGKRTTVLSTNLGKDMDAAGLKPPKDKVPTPALIWQDCLPSKVNFYDETFPEKFSNLGRYITEIDTWRTRVWYYKFNTDNWQNVYRGTNSRMGDALNRNISGVGYTILDIGKPWKKRTYNYFKLICADGSTSGNRLAQIVDVANGTQAGRDAVNWGDSNPSYYTWNCGGTPGGGDSHNPANDFLQCDTYGQRSTAPYQYDRMDYTYSTGTRDAYGWRTVTQFMDRGADYINGQWIGRPCPAGWYDAGHNCAQDRQEWGVVGTESYSIKNPTPAGWLDNGSYWYKKAAAPAGWFDNGTEYETTSFPNLKVENKNAAPLINAALLTDEGDVVDLEYKNGAFQMPTTADPVHFEWQRIRINTRDGRNINNAGENVVWEYQYRLAPWSSPMLKGVSVNALNQPYHGWIDSTPSTVEAGEIPLNTKWEPDKFYEYKTIPYTYTYKDYTYTNETEYLPRQVTTETYTYWGHNGWGYAWGCSCGGKCGNWSNGDPYCQYATYGWITETRTVVAPPPAGCYDNGSQYVCSKDVKDAPPPGYTDNLQLQKYQKQNPAPAGYVDNGAGGYTSKDVINDSGRTGGIAFDQWRKWPSNSGLTPCTINMSRYNDALTGTQELFCGDNVTDQMRGAYFRFFQSSTAGSQGWQVTPWARVTADVQVSFEAVDGFTLNPDGTMSMGYSSVTNKWLRQSYDCPAQPVRINVTRTVS